MNHIAQAVEPRRAASIERARNLANENICRAYLDLAVNDWDLDKAAPGPNGRMSRVAYKMAQAKRDFYTSITVAHPDAPRRIRNTDPRPVVTSDERIAIVRAQGCAGVVEGTLGRWFTPGFRQSRPDATAPIARLIANTPPAGYIGCAAAIRHLDITSRTWASSRTISEITVARSATPAGDAATCAPLSANGAVAASTTSNTVRPPGWSHQRFAIGAPI